MPKIIPQLKYFLLSLLLTEDDYKVIYEEGKRMGIPAHVVVHLLVTGFVYWLRHGQFDQQQWLADLLARTKTTDARSIVDYITANTLYRHFSYPELTANRLKDGRVRAWVQKPVLADPSRLTAIHVARLLRSWYRVFINAFGAQSQPFVWNTWLRLWYQGELPPINTILGAIAIDYEKYQGNLPPAHKWLQAKPWLQYQEELKKCVYHRDRPGKLDFFGAWYCEQCVENIGLRPVEYIYIDKSKRGKKRAKEEQQCQPSAQL